MRKDPLDFIWLCHYTPSLISSHSAFYYTHFFHVRWVSIEMTMKVEKYKVELPPAPPQTPPPPILLHCASFLSPWCSPQHQCKLWKVIWAERINDGAISASEGITNLSSFSLFSRLPPSAPTRLFQLQPEQHQQLSTFFSSSVTLMCIWIMRSALSFILCIPALSSLSVKADKENSF